VNGLLFITIHGAASGELITFKALENTTGQEFKITESVNFEEILIGNPNQPYKLTISGLTGTGVENTSFSIYPNPVNTILYIGGDLSKIKGIQVLKITGETIIKTDTFVKGNGLDVSYLPAGTYLIAIRTEAGIHYYKFIKSISTK
jgi:hypothetical protein